MNNCEFKTKISMLVFKLEELNYIDCNLIYTSPSLVKNFEFIYKCEAYKIEKVFLNDYMEFSKKDNPYEVIDYHFEFKIDNIDCELVYSEDKDCFFIQSIDENIQEKFRDVTFIKSDNYKPNNYFFDTTNRNIQFAIDNCPVNMENMQL